MFTEKKSPTFHTEQIQKGYWTLLSPFEMANKEQPNLLWYFKLWVGQPTILQEQNSDRTQFPWHFFKSIDSQTLFLINSGRKFQEN